MSQTKRIALLVVGIAGCAIIALLRLNLSYDLAFFLPPATTEAQKILLERVGQGPGTQLTFVVLPQQAPSAEAVDTTKLANAIRRLPQVQRVLPEQPSLALEQIPRLLWQYRALLADLPANKAQWVEALYTTLDDMMFASDASEREVLAGDPTLASLAALEQFTRLANTQEFSSGGQSVLLVQASAAAFDLDAQTQLVDNLRQLLADNQLDEAKLYGSGVYGVDLQRSVQHEATLYSLLASAALLALLFLYLRSAKLLLVTGLPLLAGGVAGLTALALVFTEVHGITLAFGFTLLGVAVDYPLHLVIHQQLLSSQSNSIWPTLRLGVLSTAIAYLAFALSGTQGLQQLGLFALVGVTVAACASAWLCPSPKPLTQAKETHLDALADLSQRRSQLRHWPWLAVLIGALSILVNLNLFSDDLSALTPVPAATLVQDSKLRDNLGVANMRHLLALRGADQEQLLEQTEALTRVLNDAVERNRLDAFQSISSLLPSKKIQRERLNNALSKPSVDGFAEALAELPFTPGAFASFSSMLTNLASSNLLTWEQVQQDPNFGAAANNMLYATSDGWVSLVFLTGIKEPEILREQIETLDLAQWVDLKAASITLASNYRQRVLYLLAFALAGIIGVLLTLTREPQRVLWLVGTGAATVACAMLGSLLLQGLLSLFDLMALTLVAGLGLDYALFYSKPNPGSKLEQQATAKAVLLCALSSLLVFGILACSSIPLLQGIGTTVACGVIAAYLLARLGCYAKEPS